MRKSILVAVGAALAIALPHAASANSKSTAIVVCNDTGGAVQVVAASVTPGLTAPVAGADCATSIGALLGSGVKIQSVVQTASGWVYTLSSASSQNSQGNQN